MLLHLRVPPGFGIAVEARDRPELHSIPAIMGGSPRPRNTVQDHDRGIVHEANFPAQNRGVQPGMTLAQARQYCAGVLLLLPDDALYAAVWEQLCSILRQYTPLVEPLERGQAVLDLSGCPGGRDESARAEEIRHAVWSGTGVIPWLGIAANRLVAELASRDAGDGGITIIPAGCERAFLADLPLTTLPDVDARLALTFQILGLRTIGQFAALPRSAVRQRFGALGERLHAWSRGIDSRPVVPPAEEPAVRVRGECEEGTPEDAIATLHRLAGECAAELQQRSLAGTLITLTLLWPAGDRALPGDGKHLPGANEPVRRITSAPARPAAIEQAFPVAYRIHSMLPQPGLSAAGPGAAPDRGDNHVPATLPGGGQPVSSEQAPPRGAVAAYRDETLRISDLPDEGRPFTTLTTLTRTPITDSAPLFERARDLLLRYWRQDREPRACPIGAIELAISSFEEPVQLAFAELNRLDGIGTLRGMDAPRRRAFAQAEEALASRYGDTFFRRLAHLDPANILTERRFRWEAMSDIGCQ